MTSEHQEYGWNSATEAAERLKEAARRGPNISFYRVDDVETVRAAFERQRIYIDQLERERDTLRAALEPFAIDIDPRLNDSDNAGLEELTVGMCRRARAALAGPASGDGV